ncbi:hypothetical protein V8E53_000267 [Lactarius tabidus]
MCTSSDSIQHIYSPRLCLDRLLANMVDFHDPAIIEDDFLAVVKFWHILDGIFIWEFLGSLHYEWSVIRGHRPYRWTIWIYSMTRVCTLIAAILNMLAFDSSSPINCQLWVIFEATFAYLAFATASILIVLRIIAIWDRNKIAVAIAMCAWGTNVAFSIHSITLLHSAWVPEQRVCAVLNTDSSLQNILSTLATDVALLLTMLFGLLSLRRKGSMFSLGQLLWKQGLIWLLLATIAEVPPAVFISLNLNDPLNLMFQTPALIGMSIAATRMYRSLTDFTDSCGRYPTPKGRTSNTDPKLVFSAPIPLPKPVAVAVNRSLNDYPPAKTDQYASHGLDSADSLPKNMHPR